MWVSTILNPLAEIRGLNVVVGALSRKKTRFGTLFDRKSLSSSQLRSPNFSQASW
ncbi:MAG: hypothetical protein V7K89_00495 [Nostoc sp.]|uniref:hypothetical protein n=1 Tax=Nostoc sp. TaxID=1180 RepID=UPI002FF8A36D